MLKGKSPRPASGLGVKGGGGGGKCCRFACRECLVWYLLAGGGGGGAAINKGPLFEEIILRE